MCDLLSAGAYTGTAPLQSSITQSSVPPELSSEEQSPLPMPSLDSSHHRCKVRAHAWTHNLEYWNIGILCLILGLPVEGE